MSVSVVVSVEGISYGMKLAPVGARFRQPGFAGAVGCGEAEGDDDGDADGETGGDPDDGTEGDGDGDAAPELDAVGTVVGAADGQPTPGNTCTSLLTPPPGWFCSAYSTGRPAAPTMAWSSWRAGTETLARLGVYPEVPSRPCSPPGDGKQSNSTVDLRLVTSGWTVASVAADCVCGAVAE